MRWTTSLPMLCGMLALAACTSKPHALLTGAARGSQSLSACTAQVDDAQEPTFIRNCYQPFSRAAAVAFALAEWRAWGQVVYDDDPRTEQPPDPNAKAERQDGNWQRIGLYWWLGMNQSDPAIAWTGKHDESGAEFSPDGDAHYAWSAAFISFVMRMAGAGPSFPYSESHSDYINAAASETASNLGQYAIQAEPPERYAPQLGDLICFGRGKAEKLRYAQLPAGHFPGHCGIVVARQPGQISIIGGNVEDAVALTHVPVTDQGALAQPDGTVLDTRYPWLVVIHVEYAM